MFSVVSLTLSKTKLAGKDWPDLDVLVTINGYQWTPAGATVGAQ